jgi:hypothetical protein
MSCAAVQDQLPELALGVLDGAERADVLDHLEHCQRCRTLAAAHASTADALGLLAPEAEPPAGFVLRTQRAIGAERGDRSRWPGRRRAMAMAAAAAMVVIATLATVRIVDATRADTPGRVHEAAMVGGGDHAVGRAYATEADGEDFVFVSVDYGVGAGRYSVDVEGGHGVVRVGTMTVAEGRGEWAGPSGAADGPPRKVRLVDATGSTVCTATFVAS